MLSALRHPASFAVLLIGAALVVFGVAQVYPPAGHMLGAVLISGAITFASAGISRTVP
jgi:hypothetical protein